MPSSNPVDPVANPIVVVATFTAKPQSVDAVREACERAVAAVHAEPGCELYALHQADRTFVFVEQWADEGALTQHNAAPSIGELIGAIGDHIEGAPDIKKLGAVAAGDPAKGRLRG